MEAVKGDLEQITIAVNYSAQNSPWCKDEWLTIHVSDSGRGINEDYLPLVISPYFTTNKHGGHSGFGLALANKIIKAHQGYLEIKSEENKGTDVSISLPVKPKSNESKEA